MVLLTSALVIILLSTASAKPTGRHCDADIADKDLLSDWLEMNRLSSSESWESTSSVGSSSSEESVESSQSSMELSESNESLDSESDESSEEVVVPVQTTPVPATPTVVMTTFTRGDNGSVTTGPGEISTEGPIIGETTPQPTNVTSPGAVTACVTVLIPTPSPVTDNRGDN